MRKFVLIRNECPACGAPMIPDKYDFYTCSGCGAQVCPPSDSKREVKRQISAAMGGQTIKVKSKKSGSKSGKSKKEQMKKSSQHELYCGLCR